MRNTNSTPARSASLVQANIGRITPDALDDLTALHLQAFSNYNNSRIGKRFVRSLLNWFVQRDDAVRIMATSEGGDHLGYVVGAPLGYHKQLSRDLLLPGILGLIFHPAALLNPGFRRRVAERCQSLLRRDARLSNAWVLPDPVMSLGSIAVLTSARGNGIGNLLVQAFERECSQRGVRSMRLTVYKSNTAARRLYESRGWMAFDFGDSEKLHYYLIQSVRSNHGTQV